MSTFTIFLVLIVVVAFLLVVVIMVQNPKGGGLASTFGGGGGSQQMGGVQKTTDFLDKSTWTLATILIALILASNIAIGDNSGTTESRALDSDAIEQPLPEAQPLPDTSNDTGTTTEDDTND